MNHRMRVLLIVAIAIVTAVTCSSTGPEWNGNVSDSDPCQPVREQKMGGVIIFCKGKCPSEASTCGTLQSRSRGTENQWKDDDGSTYNSSNEYRCVCHR